MQRPGQARRPVDGTRRCTAIPVAGNDRPPELGLVDPDDVHLDAPGVRGALEEPDPGGLGEALHDQDARHHRGPGEMALEDGGLRRDVRLRSEGSPGGVEFQDAINEAEVLKVHAGVMPT